MNFSARMFEVIIKVVRNHRQLPSHCCFSDRPGKCIKDEWGRTVAQTFYGSSGIIMSMDLKANIPFVKTTYITEEHIPCYSSITALKPTKTLT